MPPFDSQRPKSFKRRVDFERHCSSGKEVGICWRLHSLGKSNVPLSIMGEEAPSYHSRHHLEVVAAGMGTFVVPDGFVKAEKCPPSYFLLRYTSCDRG